MPASSLYGISLRFRALVLTAALLANHCPAETAVPARSGRLRWNIGAVYRTGMRLSAGGADMAREFPASTAVPLPRARDVSVRDPAPVGPDPDDITRFGDRDFDDGFVHRDAWTEIGPPLIPAEGWTVNWGYRDAAQIDAAARTLTFTRGTVMQSAATAAGMRTERSVQTLADGDPAAATRFGSIGLALGAGLAARPRGASEMGLAATIRVFPDIRASVAGANLRREIIDRRIEIRETLAVTDSVTDVYVFGTEDPRPFPPPGYDGAGADPLVDFFIDNRPSAADRHTVRRRETIRTRSETGRARHEIGNRFEYDLRADFVQAALGGEFAFRLAPGLRALITPEISFNYLNASVERHEILYRVDASGRTAIAAWHDRADRQDWLWGAQIQAGAELAMRGGWHAGLRAGYESVESRRMDIGPGRLKIDMSAVTAGISLGRFF